jgi:hypothetical protein
MSELSPLALTISQQAAVIKKAMEEVNKLQATEQISIALQNQNGLHINNVVGLPLGLEVLIWQIHKKRWTGLYKLLAI